MMSPRSEDMSAIRGRIGTIAESLGLSDTELFDLKVAVGEAVANAVRHGSITDQDVVTISVSVFDHLIRVEVGDSGAGFAGDHAVSEDLYSPGGRGIMFMRALMDNVYFAPGPSGGTIVTLEKHRPVVD